MPKVQPLDRVHPDGTVEHGFTVLDPRHAGMELPFFATMDEALEHANELSALRQMAAVAL